MMGVGRNGMTSGFLNINRGMALDLHSPAGIEVVHRLVATADVFVQNMRPGVDAVRAIKPDIV